MKRILTNIFLILCLVVRARAAELTSISTSAPSNSTASTTNLVAAHKPWPHEDSDLKPDAKITWGKLDNGLRYVILPNKQAPTRASLRLYMNVGSMMEADDQRGMAHFLEHLAFRSSKNFPAGEKIEYMQRLGMGFAADVNAETRADRTVYQLELPRANEEVLGDGLKLFRDFLDGALLDSKEIEKERGVILGEILARNTADRRAVQQALQFALPETMAARRWVSGDIKSVKSLTRQRFADFYETWYTPGRAVIVAVGDFDVPLVERLVKQSFGDVTARRGERLDPDFGKVVVGTRPLAKLHTDADLSAVSVELDVIRPASSMPDCVARQREDLIRMMANLMLNARLQKLVAAGDTAIQSASVEFERSLNLAEVNTLSAGCQAQRWPEAIGVLEQQLRQAVQYGFNATELGEMKTRLGTMLESLVGQADSRQPSELADGIVESLIKKEVFMHPVYELPLAKQFLAEVTREDCQAALQAAWNTQDIRLWVQGNLRIEGNSEQQILAAYRASQQKPVAPPAEEAAGKFAYTDFGSVGTIVKRTEQKDLGFVQAELGNNVRVNIKATPFEKNSAYVLVRFGGGLLELPADKPGLKLLADSTFIAGGLKAHSLMEIGRTLADKKARVQFVVGDDAFNLIASGDSAALETQLQLCAAYLTAPGYRPEAYKQFVDSLDAYYAHQQHTLEGALGKNGAVFSFLRSDEPRFGTPDQPSLRKLTLDDLQAWMAQPLANGYMEVTIVGDVKTEEALQLVAKTLGALPARAATKPYFKHEREVKFPTSKAKEFRYASATPRAAAVVCWPTGVGSDTARTRRISALADILNDRLRIKVREELGATYTPEVGATGNDVFPQFGYIAAVLTLEPDQVAKIGPLVATIAAELAQGPISDDEFDRALKPTLASLDSVALDNGYWLGTLSKCQESPEVLDAARGRISDWKSITKAELQAAAKEYLSAGGATVLSIVPSMTSE